MAPHSRRYIRIIKHEAVKDTGSFEVRFPNGRRVYFYFEDNKSRRLRPEQLTRDQALAKARELARAERDKMKRAR